MGARNIRGFSLSSFTLNIYKVLAETLTTRIHHGLDEVVDGASMTGKKIQILLLRPMGCARDYKGEIETYALFSNLTSKGIRYSLLAKFPSLHNGTKGFEQKDLKLQLFNSLLIA